MKGATSRSAALHPGLRVSIHAPVKGATLRESRRNQKEKVSIHAPVKGATALSGDLPESTSGFNPRTREGCDGQIIHLFAYMTEIDAF